MDACRRAGLSRGLVTRGDGAAPEDETPSAFRLSAPRRWGATVRGFDLHAGGQGVSGCP